jgi:hypothetical protein
MIDVADLPPAAKERSRGLRDAVVGSNQIKAISNTSPNTEFTDLR